MFRKRKSRNSTPRRVFKSRHTIKRSRLHEYQINVVFATLGLPVISRFPPVSAGAQRAQLPQPPRLFIALASDLGLE